MLAKQMVHATTGAAYDAAKLIIEGGEFIASQGVVATARATLNSATQAAQSGIPTAEAACQTTRDAQATLIKHATNCLHDVSTSSDEPRAWYRASSAL